jgi:biopolymer transport protein ExbD
MGEAALDITPLIDVVFQLLLFLLVTTTFRANEHAFVIDLPTSTAENLTVTTDRTTVFLGADGSLHWLSVSPSTEAPPEPENATSVTQEELHDRLAELYKKDPEASIAVRGEKTVSYQGLMDVVSLIQGSGFRQIWFPYEHAPATPAEPKPP